MIDDHMPVAAVDWIIANDPGDRPFNQYSWGGYLGLRVPEDPTFIDGRSDIYGDAPIREFAEAVQLRIDPRWRVDAAGEFRDQIANYPATEPIDRLSRVAAAVGGFEAPYQ